MVLLQPTPLPPDLRHRPEPRGKHYARFFICVAFLVFCMAACSHNSTGAQDAHPPPAPQPDWVRASNGPPHPAQLGIDPSTRTGHPLDPIPAPLQWRFWRYAVPGIEQLSLPRSSPMDIALVGIDGRIKAIAHEALCRPDDCEPIQSKFPAIGILVANPGNFRQSGLDEGSRITYGQPALPPAQVFALK